MRPAPTCRSRRRSPSAARSEGVILGTAAYMSPEQARGRPVDKRADVWAFGCVLYEMLTGRLAFPGDTLSDTIASILQGEPDWRALPETTPAGIRRLLRRCLEKDPTRRLRDIGDARLDIEEALTAPAQSQTVESPSAVRRWPTRVAWALAAVGIAAAIGMAVLYFRGTRAQRPAMRPVYARAAAECRVGPGISRFPRMAGDWRSSRDRVTRVCCGSAHSIRSRRNRSWHGRGREPVLVARQPDGGVCGRAQAQDYLSGWSVGAHLCDVPESRMAARGVPTETRLCLPR